MIKEPHLKEWLKSGVDRSIVELNVRSLDGDDIYDYLTWHLVNRGIDEPGILRNDGRLRDNWLDRYRHCELGGWWCSGIDVLTGEGSDWGQFKPDNPRTYQISVRSQKSEVRSQKGFGRTKTKTIKYESPPKADTEIYALRVPLHIWEAIAKLNNVSMPFQKSEVRSRASVVTNTKLVQQSSTIDTSNKLISTSLTNENNSQPKKTSDFKLLTSDFDLTSREASGFWSWVLKTPEIPLIITEGAKKAGCLLTAGYVAIALPGIYNGYHQDKDQFNKAVGLPKLIPQLEPFAVEGREIVFCFDRDRKPKTQKNVRTAIVKTGKLFERKGCTVKVVTWNHPAKGVDDLIAATDVDYFHDCWDRRLPLISFELANLLDLSPYADLTVNERYLPESLIPPDSAQLIGLSSRKNTGKTEWLSRRVDRNRELGIKTLVITHRIQLAKALAERFGIDHIEELRSSTTGGVFGYSLCIDSVHPNSMARFHPEEWEGSHIIIDEAVQVFWHQLNSTTCQKKRVTILQNFTELLRIAIATGGKIYLSDADLSPIEIEYVLKLIGHSVKKWVVKNNYNVNKNTKRVLVSYSGNDPRELVTALKSAIASGQKVLVHTSGQKHRSRTGTINLERYFKKLFPYKKILRIDAETVADPQHRAYGCMGNLNTILPQYDIVLASPVIETGVSIDIKNHFDSVWCVAQGVQTVDAVCQALERLRDDCPRHLWAKTTGMNRVGNGSTDIKRLFASTQKLAQANIDILSKSGISIFDGIDFNWQKAHLETWVKRAVIVNAGMSRYRESILEKLKHDGYKIEFDADPDPEKRALQEEKSLVTNEEIIENKEASYGEYCQKVVDAEIPGELELEVLREKRSKTEAERLKEHKGNLKQKYQVDVTPELVEKDDKGWYRKLQLHYYLTVGERFLPGRDKKKLATLMEEGGSLFKPDINKQCLGAIVYALKALNIEQFFDANMVFSKHSLKDWFEVLNNPMTRGQIRTILGVTINAQKDTPIAVANRILKLLGLKLELTGSTGGRDNKHRIYQGCRINPDERDKVFAKWFDRDSQLEDREVA